MGALLINLKILILIHQMTIIAELLTKIIVVVELAAVSESPHRYERRVEMLATQVTEEGDALSRNQVLIFIFIARGHCQRVVRLVIGFFWALRSMHQY